MINYVDINIIYRFFLLMIILLKLTNHSDIPDQLIFFSIFWLSRPAIPMDLINNEILILVKSVFFLISYQLLIDLSPSIFIVCDFVQLYQVWHQPMHYYLACYAILLHQIVKIILLNVFYIFSLILPIYLAVQCCLY